MSTSDPHIDPPRYIPSDYYAQIKIPNDGCSLSMSMGIDDPHRYTSSDYFAQKIIFVWCSECLLSSAGIVDPYGYATLLSTSLGMGDPHEYATLLSTSVVTVDPHRCSSTHYCDLKLIYEW